MTMTTLTPRYDLARNPPYQIDFRAKRAGKHISASKRRVTFRFGFSRAADVAAGRAGGECRGSEHEVVLVWSHASGKRRLWLDGREVHASKAARGNTRFEYAWPAFGGHDLKILASGTPPPQGSGKRQFDLELDGLSFFRFKRIYELGAEPARATTSRRGLALAQDSRDDYEEEEEDEEALEAAPPVPSVDLLDAQPSVVSPATQYSSMGSMGSSVPSLIGSIASSTTSAYTTSYDEFLPVEPVQMTKSFEAISNEILCAYHQNQVPASAAAPTATPCGAAPAPAGHFNTAPSHLPVCEEADQVTTSLQDLVIECDSTKNALVPVREELDDRVATSVRDLVNLDDLASRPVQPLAQNAPSLDGMKGGQTDWGRVGRAPTLAEISAMTAAPPPPAVPAGPGPAACYKGGPQVLVGGQQAGSPSYYGQPSSLGVGYAPAY